MNLGFLIGVWDPSIFFADLNDQHYCKEHKQWEELNSLSHSKAEMNKNQQRYAKSPRLPERIIANRLSDTSTSYKLRIGYKQFLVVLCLCVYVVAFVGLGNRVKNFQIASYVKRGPNTDLLACWSSDLKFAQTRSTCLEFSSSRATRFVWQSPADRL